MINNSYFCEKLVQSKALDLDTSHIFLKAFLRYPIVENRQTMSYAILLHSFNAKLEDIGGMKNIYYHETL